MQAESAAKERFNYDSAVRADTGGYAGASAPAAKAQPRILRQSSVPAGSVTERKSISVDELVGRLYQAHDKYEQKRTARRVSKSKEDDNFSYQPSLNRRSIVMASGVEGLQARMFKIAQQKEAKLEKARAKQDQATEDANVGQPTITGKASRISRGIEALHRWDEKKNQKIMQRQHQKAQERLQECTFQPNVSKSSGSKKLAIRSDVLEHELFNDEHYVHNRLHEDAHRRQVEKAAKGNRHNHETQGGPASSTFRRRPEHNVSTASSSTAPRPASQRASSARSLAARQPGSGTTEPAASGGAKPLSFEAFMRSLAAENADPDQQQPARPSSSKRAEAQRPEA